MSFFTNAIDVLQTLVIALAAACACGAASAVWKGYGQDNPASNAHVR